MGARRLRAPRRGLRMAAITSAVVVLTATAALGHAGPWVAESEGGLSSEDAIESESAHPDRPNLCEGKNGIPTGGDPGWARTNGSPNPNTPFTEARGQVFPDLSYKTNPFVTHTDAPFNHYSHDVNVFLTLDKPFRHLLASGNFAEIESGFENEHSMIELEWERSGVPFFAYPAQSDRMYVWGPHVWDCGHGEPQIIPNPNPPPDFTVGPAKYRTEIHPPVGWVSVRNSAAKSDREQTPPPSKANQDPWIWYEPTDHQGIATTLPSTPLRNTPVQAGVADAFFSSYGGDIPEALNGCDDDTLISSDTMDADCLAVFTDDFEWFQPVLNQDYSFFVAAPPRPSPGAVLVWESEDHCGDVPSDPGNPPGDNVEDVSEADDTAENIGAPTCNIPDQVQKVTENGQPGIRVTVKASSGGATYPSNHYVAFAKRYKVAWDEAPAVRPRVFNASIDNIKVYDDTEDTGNDGEWVVSLTVQNQWLHPVRGHGDDNAPFWENGALDDGCDDDDSCTYSIGESFNGLGVVPGEKLNVKFRGWDDDTTFVQDNDVNEILPVVNKFHDVGELPGSFLVDGVDMVGTEDGSYKLGYHIDETTPTPPTDGTLAIGDPKYGPNADTGGTATRVSGSTPLTFSGSDATELAYRFWKDGTDKPESWISDTTAPFNASLASASSDGRYTIEYRPVSAGGIVGQSKYAYVELDTTPPALTVPADFEVLATETGGAHVTYTFSATDNLPGPVTASCTPASGTLFPNGHNAPLTTTVTCTATDAVQNTGTKTFNVTVKSPFGYVNDFVLLSRDWTRVGPAVQVQSGNVGAFQASAGIPNLPGVEVQIQNSTTLLGGPQVAAHTDQLDVDVHAGDVFRVDKIIAAASATYTPKVGYVPLFYGMPVFPSYSATGADRSLMGTQSLASGNYGNVVVGPTANVTLTGGDYFMKSLEVKPGGKLRASAPSKLYVTGRVLIGNTSTFGPVPGSGVSAHDIVVYADGLDGPAKKPINAIQLGSNTVVGVNAYAGRGTISVGAYSLATGAFVGLRVDIASNVVLNRDSTFLSP